MSDKRYSLVLPEALYKQVKDAADEDGLTILALLIFCIKIGLRMRKIARSSGGVMTVEEDGRYKEIVIL